MTRRGWTAERFQQYREEIRAGRDPSLAVDNFTSSVESLLIALGQRHMDEAQMDRLAVILQRAELDLLRRCTSSSAKAQRRAPARSSGRSGSRAA